MLALLPEWSQQKKWSVLEVLSGTEVGLPLLHLVHLLFGADGGDCPYMLGQVLLGRIGDPGYQLEAASLITFKGVTWGHLKGTVGLQPSLPPQDLNGKELCRWAHAFQPFFNYTHVLHDHHLVLFRQGPHHPLHVGSVEDALQETRVIVFKTVLENVSMSYHLLSWVLAASGDLRILTSSACSVSDGKCSVPCEALRDRRSTVSTITVLAISSASINWPGSRSNASGLKHDSLSSSKPLPRVRDWAEHRAKL